MLNYVSHWEKKIFYATVPGLTAITQVGMCACVCVCELPESTNRLNCKIYGHSNTQVTLMCFSNDFT